MDVNKRNGTVIGAVLIIAGLGIIVAVILDTGIAVRVMLGLIGLGFIALGFVPPLLARRRQADEERHRETMAKLDEIKEAIEAAKEEKKGGVAVADIISTGMKWYADYMGKDKKEGEE